MFEKFELLRDFLYKNAEGITLIFKTGLSVTWSFMRGS